MSICETEVWCSEREVNENLGIDSGDCWMPIAFNWQDVLTIKEAGSNEFIGEKKATIYIGCSHFIIHMDYYEAVTEFKKQRL